jgi:hypothetical protein
MVDPRTSYLSGHFPDLRVEFIFYELLETGLDPDDVIINALSIFKRRYSKDVVRGEIREYKESKRKYFQLEINRNGIYDLLPKGLFHQPQNRKNNTTYSQAIEEHKLQKQIESESRLFFLPFEQEIYRLALMLEAEERKSIFDVQNVFNNQVFIEFWNIPDLFNERQICNLLYILPLASFITGNHLLTRLCFESILNDRVVIRESSPLSHQDIDTGAVRLNHTRLGVDLVIENIYHEVAPCTDLFIYPSLPEDLVGYLEGGSKLKMLNFMCGYFMPFENDVRVTIMSEEKFSLTGEEQDSRLGITTNL